MDDDAGGIEGLRPLNMYGYSKLLLDRWVRDQGLLPRVAGLRFFNVFGPNEAHKGDMRSVVHKACAQVRQEGRVQLFRSHHPDFRDGEQRRDFVYVKDVVDMTLHVAAQGAAGLFNVGSGTAHTWLDLVRPIFAALQVPERIDFVDMPEVLRGTYQYHTQADISRLRGTGYTAPPTPLAAAVTDYVPATWCRRSTWGTEGNAELEFRIQNSECRAGRALAGRRAPTAAKSAAPMPAGDCEMPELLRRRGSGTWLLAVLRAALHSEFLIGKRSSLILSACASGPARAASCRWACRGDGPARPRTSARQPAPG